MSLRRFPGKDGGGSHATEVFPARPWLSQDYCPILHRTLLFLLAELLVVLEEMLC
jgi:hypothetical protein